ARASPTNPAHRARLSRALLMSGFTKSARDVARSITRDSPKSTAGWEVLGYSLLAGTPGSPLDPAADVPGAVEAFRRLASLADTPSNSLLLAFAYQYGADGFRFSRGARLREAEAEFNHLRNELHENSADDQLLWVLFRDGRDSEVLSLA